jgi:hypothetical protein
LALEHSGVAVEDCQAYSGHEGGPLLNHHKGNASKEAQYGHKMCLPSAKERVPCKTTTEKYEHLFLYLELAVG